jgi:CubicO group peptidase (beta-lactamase class C family)
MPKRKLVAASLASVLTASAWFTFRPDVALRVAAGVAAHHVCSMTFVGGQDPAHTYAELVVPMIGGVAGRLLTPTVSRERRQVDVASPFRTLARAEFIPGYGCRLVLSGNRPLAADASTFPAATDDFARKGTVVEATDPGLIDALARVFNEHPGQPAKRVKAVVVVRDGRVIAERYAEGFGIQSPLLSFSVAKSFTNAFLGVLAREGRLRPRQPLDAPEWRSQSDPRRSITIEDLLRMRSGLDAEEAESAFSPVAQMEFLHADMAGFAAVQPAKELPGRSWEYTSADTLLVDRMIGDLVGDGPAGLREFARREMFGPLGMGDVTMEFDGQGTFVGSTYVYTTARDYARFGMLYLNDGVAPDGRRLLPEGWVAWSRRSTLGAPYGAGFWTNDGPSPPAKHRVEGGFPKDGFYASGAMGQRIYIVPSAKLVVTRFGYSDGPDYGIEDDVALIRAAISSGER